MSSLGLFVSEERINKDIKYYEERKNNLNKIVGEFLEASIKKKFINEDYDQILKDYNREIIEIKQNLYKEFLEGIEEKIRILGILKREGGLVN